MNTNWIIIGIVIAAGVALVVYLVKKNLSDQEEVTDYFNNEYRTKPGKESELGNDDEY